MARSITKHTLSNEQTMVDYLRDREQMVDEAHRKIDELKRMVDSVVANPVSTKALPTIQQNLQSTGVAPLNVTGLIGQLNEPQYARVPKLTTHPDPLTAPYDLYVLTGAPNTLWAIDRTINPPTKYQIG